MESMASPWVAPPVARRQRGLRRVLVLAALLALGVLAARHVDVGYAAQVRPLRAAPGARGPAELLTPRAAPPVAQAGERQSQKGKAPVLDRGGNKKPPTKPPKFDGGGDDDAWEPEWNFRGIDQPFLNEVLDKWQGVLVLKKMYPGLEEADVAEAFSHTGREMGELRDKSGTSSLYGLFDTEDDVRALVGAEIRDQNLAITSLIVNPAELSNPDSRAVRRVEDGLKEVSTMVNRPVDLSPVEGAACYSVASSMKSSTSQSDDSAFEQARKARLEKEYKAPRVGGRWGKRARLWSWVKARLRKLGFKRR